MTQSSVDDPVEIIRLHHMEPLKLPRSFRVDAAYTQLDAEGVDRLITLAIERFEEDDEDTGEAIVSCLSTFTDAPLDRLLTVLLAEHVTPPIAFRRADDRYAVAIIDSLHENPEAREWALPCLAWIGSDRVAAFLADTEARQPEWAKGLLCGTSPGRVAHWAGWEPEDGRRRNLYLEPCFALSAAADGAAPEPGHAAGIRVWHDAQGNCE